jgi:4-amino-4-deoxy-L-arabinose transferase-like glycosyltransferase
MAGGGSLSWAEVSTSAMHTALSPAPAARYRALAVGLPALAALFYGLAHLNWYLGTPLGRVPVLDERENIDLANAIFGGTLPHEPLYRAPGYALVLAGLRAAGIPAGGLFPAALLLGVALHGIGTALAAALAGRWFGTAAAAAAGLLFAFDPVLVHYATQALDAELGLILFLAGLLCFAAAVAAPARMRPWAFAGIFWAAATLVRPNYLLVWCMAPLAAALVPSNPAIRFRAAMAALAGVLLFGTASIWQKAETGTAGFLPWQGPYNLWAANRPGANGRYYTQRVSLAPELARPNPARAESIFLYHAETGDAGSDIPAMNAHWRQRFLDEVTTHPLVWARLMARKAYALANNWEQYNNKTFAFHKARSPWLSWNPICWGLLFTLAVAGFARLAVESPRSAAWAAGVAAATAASILLFFVSARFRLPLAALCAVLAGGALASPLFWRRWPVPRLEALAACLALAVFLSFSRLGGVDDPSTFVQDHVLLARAAYTVGDDRMALDEARAALQLQPRHPDALIIEKAASAQLRGNAAVP